MHLLFLDESGTPPRFGVEYPRRFVVGGMIIPETAWHAIRDGFQGLKIRHGIRGEVKWRFFSPSNDSDDNPMRKMSVAERNAVRADIYKMLRTTKSVKAIAAVISNEAAYAMQSISSQNDIYALAYKGVTERFQYYLQDTSRDRAEKQYGLIVSD
jgi:hypothetical protein